MNVNLKYGLRDGRLIHINDVENGLKCKCYCPSCNHPLVARKGKLIAHHFAHYNGADCNKGIETAIHLLAKDILLKNKNIRIPRVEIEFESYIPNWILHEENTVSFDKVIVEKKINNIIPDVIIYVQERPLLIEITVTNKTNDEKITKISNLGFSCLEIDLSKINYDISFEELEHIIIEDTKHKKWLTNNKVNQIRKKAISFTEKKKVVQRGLALHVDLCPINKRVYQGKPFANVYNDCLICEYCLHVETGEYENQGYGGITEVYCAGKSRVNSIEQLKRIGTN